MQWSIYRGTTHRLRKREPLIKTDQNDKVKTLIGNKGSIFYHWSWTHSIRVHMMNLDKFENEPNNLWAQTKYNDEPN